MSRTIDAIMRHVMPPAKEVAHEGWDFSDQALLLPILSQGTMSFTEAG